MLFTAPAGGGVMACSELFYLPAEWAENVGTAKACYVGPEGYAFCAAGENGTCSFNGTKDVAYGANGKFVFETATNGVACNQNAFGGDPIFGVVKACYLK